MVKRKGGGKKQVLHLSEFLGDAAPVTPAAPPVWNDECPTDLSLPAPSAYDPSLTKVDITSLPSAPRAQREGSFDPSKVPRSPPFTAYVGNLPFDTEDDDVMKMFARNTVKEVRLLKDKETGHFKGFGYVEFETAEGLIEALKMNEKIVRGRPIKIDVATTAGNRDQSREGQTDRWDRDRNNDGPRERTPYVDTTSDDWRRDVKPQDDSAPDPAPYQRRPRRYDDDDERSPRGRYDDNANDTFSRSEFGTKMNDAAKEPYKPRFRDGHDDRGDRGDRGAWGRDRGNRDRGDERTEQPWVRLGEGASESSPKAERPRLNLKPRTAPVSEEPRNTDKPNPFGRAKPVDVRESPEGGERKAAATAAPPQPKSNPFGAAKPADTASWRSSRVQGTGPIKTPTAQKVLPNAIKKDDVSDEIITDSNKFMLLDEEEAM